MDCSPWGLKELGTTEWLTLREEGSFEVSYDTDLLCTDHKHITQYRNVLWKGFQHCKITRTLNTVASIHKS